MLTLALFAFIFIPFFFSHLLFFRVFVRFLFYLAIFASTLIKVKNMQANLHSQQMARQRIDSYTDLTKGKTKLCI